MHPHQPNKLLHTPLYYAIETGNQTIFEMLIKDKRVSVEWSDKFGDSPFHLCAREGLDQFMRLLVQQPFAEKVIKWKN